MDDYTIEPAEQKRIRKYAERWIGQFENSSLLKCEFEQRKLPLGNFFVPVDDQIVVTLQFRVPVHSQGSLFGLTLIVNEEHAFDMVATALWRQQKAYLEIPIHNDLKFTPMEATDGKHEN